MSIATRDTTTTAVGSSIVI